jgi:alanine racemase
VSVPPGWRPAWAEVDLAAVARNAAALAALVAPAALCAVVKAGGYGHGAVPAARAALAGGATGLAVALVEEGAELRAAGIDAPVLLLSEPPPAAMDEVVADRLTPTVYTTDGLEALSKAVAAHPGAEPFALHIKVDTGMHRVGATEDGAVALARRVAAEPHLRLEGLWTHLAVSEQVDHPHNRLQLERFERAAERLAAAGVRPPLLHAANSGAALWHPSSRYGMVRCGITLYGLLPAAGPGAGPAPELEPALSLKARVAYVKEVESGEALSYGLRYRLERRSTVATVPLGYADGVTRALSERGASVLIGGRRRRLAGTVTMDQLLVDCGPGADVAPGDEVVLIGRQGGEEVGAWEWATATGTIAYEVVCGISARVPRVYLDRR